MNFKQELIDEFTYQKEKIDRAQSIVLYGNSVISCILKVSIRELGFEKTCCVFDRGDFISGGKDIDINNVVVILCSSRMNTRNDMKEDSKKFFPEACVFDFYAIYYMWITTVVKRICDYVEFAETLHLCRQEKCVFNIDSINTLYCNLKCKECSNGIQFRKNKRIISADSQIYYLKKLTDKMPISQCNFQGGEVFTDVNFSEFVEKHSHNSRVAIFSVATNGTILPSQEVFRVIKETGCMVRISDYGDISKYKQEIIDICCEKGIPCFTFPFAETWRRFGEYKKRNRKESELKNIKNNCCFGTRDMMFVEDKLFCCLRTLFADAMGDYNEAMKKNTLNLDTDFTKEELMDFASGKELWRMCDYCDYPMEIIEPAEQM